MVVTTKSKSLPGSCLGKAIWGAAGYNGAKVWAEPRSEKSGAS